MNFNKRDFIYCAFFIVLLSIICLFQLLKKEIIDILYFSAIIISIAVGVLHVYLVQKISKTPNRKAVILTVYIAAISAIISVVMTYFLHFSYFFISFLFAFPLPFFFRQSFIMYLLIPLNYYKLWYYPVNEEIPDVDMLDLSEIQVVQFVFQKNTSDIANNNFTARAPINMLLGQLFFIFINDYNDRDENSNKPIEFLDEKNEPYGWLFFKKKGFFSKTIFVDPELTFLQNKIGPNEIIYAKRVIDGIS